MSKGTFCSQHKLGIETASGYVHNTVCIKTHNRQFPKSDHHMVQVVIWITHPSSSILADWIPNRTHLIKFKYDGKHAKHLAGKHFTFKCSNFRHDLILIIVKCY